TMSANSKLMLRAGGTSISFADSRKDLPHRQHRNLFQRLDNQIGPGSRKFLFRMMPDEADGDALHAGSFGGLHTGDGIFHNQAAQRRNAKFGGGNQEYLGVGFAALSVFGGYDGVEERLRVG